jgi:hypothetical protein
MWLALVNGTGGGCLLGFVRSFVRRLAGYASSARGCECKLVKRSLAGF